MKLSTAQPNAGTPRSAARTDAAPVVASGPFVINLCSSTTPMALSQPESAELKRFSFYVSRRLEDGRERFRLHMGHFQTLAEAEEWLGVVREVYPGAWAGEAPGKRLRERTAAAAAVSVPKAAPIPPAVPAATRQPPAAGMTAAPAQRAPARGMPAPAQNAPVRSGAERARATTQPAMSSKPAAPNVAARQSAPPRAVRAVPTLRAAAAPQQAPRTQATARAQTTQPSNAAVTARPPAMSSAPKSQLQQPPAQKATQPQRRAQPSANAVRSATPAQAGAKARAAHALSVSNVREVLAALDETGATRQMPAPRLPAAQVPTPQRSSAPAARPDLSDSQVLRVLEQRRADGSRAEVDTSVALLRPEDTATRRALHEAVATDSAVSFAVQLDWSVQPIDVRKVPPLAIFSAYTLYSVEGSREGRRWYGLRLGFFSDAISAKQVAHYVRSEFTSVAVVPVSPKERNRASEAEKNALAKPPGGAARPKNKLPDGSSEFKLIDDLPAAPKPSQPASAPQGASHASPPMHPVQAATPTASVAPADAVHGHAPRTAAAAAPKGSASGSVSGSASKRASRSPAGRVVKARDRRSPQTLEETLEILGADQLQIDDGSGETLNDSGVRHLKVEVRKESPFTRLLDRLAERARRER
ncbi:MAG TPA: hypothetical protein VMG11_09530 [Steroidobacteraceae bacterium]|nr:hypothetical protein [Steroidobacteraceae bacterium]